MWLWFRLEIAKAQGMQLWAVMSRRRVCAHPSCSNKGDRDHLWMHLYFLASVCVSACVCIYTCSAVYDPLLATAEPPSQGKERHSDSFPVWRFRSHSCASLTGDVWNVRQDQITTSHLPQGLVGLPVSWVLLRSTRACQEGMTACFCSRAFLCCSGLKGRLKCTEEAKLSSFVPSTLPTPTPSLFSRHWNPF